MSADTVNVGQDISTSSGALTVNFDTVINPSKVFILFLLALIWYVYQGRKLRMNLENLGTAPVKKFLLNRVKHSRIYLRSRLMILGIIFILLASVGPQIGMKLTELTRQGVDIFILLDTSISMNAEDVNAKNIISICFLAAYLVRDASYQASSLPGGRLGLNPESILDQIALVGEDLECEA